MQMYSSVGAEERARIASIRAHREELEYRAFDGNDVTAPDVDNAIDGADPLAATQVIDTGAPGRSDTTARRAGRTNRNMDNTYRQLVQDTTQPDLNATPLDADEEHFQFQNDDTQMKTLRAKQLADSQELEDGFDGVVGRKRTPSESSDAAYGISKEIYNFQSAPGNAKTALEGNPAL